MIPKANQIYKHFKGNLYRIVAMAKHSETEEDMVVYQALYGEYQVYIRPLKSFVDVLDKEKYPYATQTYRFEPVAEMVEPVEQVQTDAVSLETEDLIKENYREDTYKEDPYKKDDHREDAYKKDDNKKADYELVEKKEEPAIECDVVVKEEITLDPMLEAYLDTDSYREKLNILHGLRHRITEHMLLTMAVVIDFELPEGGIEAKYDALNDCLLTKERYECNRMI